ncbi:MAG: hypothetical protein IJ802_03435 [Kiritimatiellae bacterium]|nr:hypothetical protein [Kiritimatiellia bacterium]
MQKWFKISLIVEIAVLLASALAVGYFTVWSGGDMPERWQFVRDVATDMFAACFLAILIELASLRHSAREEAAKIRRNDDLSRYYVSRFCKLYFEATFADKAAFAAERQNADFTRFGGIANIRRREIPVSALHNLFLPSEFVGGFYSKMLVEEFFDNEARLIDSFRRAIASLDYNHFEPVRDAMLAFVKASTEFSCSAEIRSTLRRRLGESKMTDLLAQWFADGSFERFRAAVLSKTTDGTDSPMLPYVVFLERLERERTALAAYEKALEPVRSLLPRN